MPNVRSALGGCRAVSLMAAAAVAGLGLLGAASASAETYNVKSTAEFTAAVAKANANPGANTIVVASGVYLPTKSLTFTNTGGLQTVEGPSGPPNVKIEAAKLEGSAIEPSGAELFTVKAGVSVEFKDVVISHGGGEEQAIEDFGSLLVEGSTIAGNLTNGIDVQPKASVIVRNTTLSDGLGGGLVNDGTATLENTTVAFNTTGGVENQGTMTLTNTIVAENKGSGDCTGIAPTTDHSLDSDGTCGVGELSEMNPLLQTTASNDGGSTPLHSLKPGSPAIGKGDPATCLKVDQRGAARKSPCSIGADEYNSVKPTLKLPADITTEEASPAGAVVEFAEEATGFESVAKVTCEPESGSTFPVKTTTVECVAKDGHENKATGSFTVTVTKKAAAAPTVTTGKASSITETGATLNGTVNPNGVAVTECKFEYATAATFELTKTYSESKPCSSLPGSGSSAVAVSAAVTGLTANTTYHFRIVASNASTKGEGADETFKTLEEPVVVKAPTVTTGKASSVAETSATLNATVNPNGTAVTACTFEYGTTAAYGKTIACSSLPGSGSSAVAVSAAVTGLTANTTYHFRIVASNASTKGEGADETFKTLEEPVVVKAPTVTTGKASSVAETSATLNATVNPNGTAVTACTFEYGTTAAYGKTIACSSLPGSGSSAVAVSAAVTGLTANTTYHFRIVASNASTKGEGADETFKTLEEPVVVKAPTVTTGKASSVAETSATLNATVNPNGTAVTACTFEYGTTAAYGKTIACSSLPGSGSSAVAVSAAVTGLTANTTYHFRIVASNASTKGEGADETFKTLEEPVVVKAPTVTTGKASSVAETSATLNATVNPNGTAVTACTFEYGTTAAYGKTIACSSLPGSGSSAVAVSAAVTGLTANTTYHFRIVASNASTKGEGADETFKTLEEPVVVKAPTVTTGKASSVAETSATLNATVNPNGTAVTACTFEYGTTAAYGKTIACSSLPGSGSSAVAVSAAVTGLTANTTYHFRIVASNASTKGEGADETFKTLEEPVVVKAPTVTTGKASSVAETSATLNATVNPNGTAVTACTFEYGTTAAYGKTIACSSLPGSGSSAVAVSAAVTGLTANTTYHFRIVASNASTKGEGADETFKTLEEPVVVKAPTVTTGKASSVAETSATLNATVNPNGTAVTACTFEYGTTAAYGKTIACSSLPGSGSSAVAVSAAVTGLTANTTYHFRIVASNASTKGEGADETFKTLEEPVVVKGPKVKLTELLHEVGSSNIPLGIRLELTALLNDALRHLPLSGYGTPPPVKFGGQSLRAQAASLASLKGKPLKGKQFGCRVGRSFFDLQLFIAVIQHDQKTRKPEIPSSLARAWIASAQSIEASLNGSSGRCCGR